jgi:hypothetical protein
MVFISAAWVAVTGAPAARRRVLRSGRLRHAELTTRPTSLSAQSGMWLCSSSLACSPEVSLHYFREHRFQPGP